MSMVSRYMARKKTAYRRRIWNIGFVDFDADTIRQPLDIAWLEHDQTDGWFADPFILHDDGERLEVLVEHFVYAEGYGHIARLTIHRDNGHYRLQEIERVIDDGTHFSFPNIYRQGREIFIYPENWQSGTLGFYRYDLSTGRAELAGKLYEAPLIDAVITEAFGCPRLVATREDRDPNGCELEIFVSESGDWRGPYIKEAEYCFTERVARGAGQFFSVEDQLIRVAQDNNGTYGGGLVFFETHYDGQRFSFTEIARHLPGDDRYNLGLHTFNIHGRIAAVDGRGYEHPLRRAVHRAKQRLRGSSRKIGSPDRPTVVKRSEYGGLSDAANTRPGQHAWE